MEREERCDKEWKEDQDEGHSKPQSCQTASKRENAMKEVTKNVPAKVDSQTTRI